MNETLVKQSASAAEKTNHPKLGVATFIMHKRLPDGSLAFNPLPRLESNVAGSNMTTVVPNDIPFPIGIPAPEGLTLLYGYSDHLEEMERQYAEARSLGMELTKIEIQLDIFNEDTQADRFGEERMERYKGSYEEVNRSRIGLGVSHLCDIHLNRCLNVTRLDKDLRDSFILQPMHLLEMKEVQGTDRVAKGFEDIYDAGRRPDLMIQVIKQNPEFKHINSVIYTIPNGRRRGRKVCTLLSTQEIAEFRLRGEPDFLIKMPNL